MDEQQWNAQTAEPSCATAETMTLKMSMERTELCRISDVSETGKDASPKSLYTLAFPMKRREPNQIRDASMARANELFPDKYDVGQQAHGGNLDFKVNWEEIEFEVCDFWHYLQSLKYKYTQMALAYKDLQEENTRLTKKLEEYGE